MYKCLKENSINEIQIKRSRFITNAKFVSNIKQAEEFIKEMKVKYKDANHNCSAYLIDDFKKADDDGEPSNTAGSAILNVLEKREMNYICVVVTRYFGGIKLGAGGLIRAYSKSTGELLDNAMIYKLVDGIEIEIICTYQQNDKVSYILSKYDIINYSQKFDVNIKYSFQINKNDVDNLVKELTDFDFTIQIKEKAYIKIPEELNE